MDKQQIIDMYFKQQDDKDLDRKRANSYNRMFAGNKPTLKALLVEQ